MTARCPLCDREAPRRFDARGHAVHRCAPCDLEFVWPPPTPEALRAVYERGYFTGDGAGYDDYFGRERALAARKAAARLDAMAHLGARGGALLDVGCAAGYFVEAAAARGWRSFGVEPSPEARAGVEETVRERVRATLAEVAPEGPFDAVTLWDVLEHLPSPESALRELRALAAPGCLFGLVLPVLGNVNTRLAPRTWDQYKPPEHLWFFSRRAVRSLLARVGLRVLREDVAWRRDARFVDPEGRARGGLVALARGLDALAHRALSVAWPDATVDSVAFYARAEAT